MNNQTPELEYLPLWRVQISGLHESTGKTVHRSQGEILPEPTELLIAKYPGEDEGIYLFYLDNSGEEMTDTFHASIHDAMEQAEWEFDVKSSEWEKVTTVDRE